MENITPEQDMQQFITAFQTMPQEQQAQLLTQLTPQAETSTTTTITPD